MRLGSSNIYGSQVLFFITIFSFPILTIAGSLPNAAVGKCGESQNSSDSSESPAFNTCGCPTAAFGTPYYTSPGGVMYQYGAMDLGPVANTDLCGYPYPYCSTKTCNVKVMFFNARGKVSETTESRKCGGSYNPDLNTQCISADPVIN